LTPATVHAVNPFRGRPRFGRQGTHRPSRPFLAAAAAKALSRPVKVVLSREQVFTATATPRGDRAEAHPSARRGTAEPDRVCGTTRGAGTPIDRSFVEPTSQWHVTGVVRHPETWPSARRWCR